jgi:orotate phosphoribosyltransferase-like protein
MCEGGIVRKKNARLIVGVAFRLYKEGCTDREIADEIGCVPSTVAFWRKRHGYTANPRRKEDIPLLFRLYGEGLNDIQVAIEAGLPEYRARYLRYRHAIPLAPRIDYEEMDRLLDQGVSYGKIAQELECSKGSITRRVRKRKATIALSASLRLETLTTASPREALAVSQADMLLQSTL